MNSTMVLNKGEYFVEVVCEMIPEAAQKCSLTDPITRFLSIYEDIDMDRIKWEISPNRVFFVVKGVPCMIRRKSEVVRGPGTNSPYAFVERFLDKYRQNKFDLFKEKIGGKEFWSIKIEYAPEPAQFVLPKVTMDILSNISWPEYMRWGPKIEWIRPIRRLFAMFMDSPLLFNWPEAGIMSSPSSILSPTSQTEFMFDSYDKYLQFLQHSRIFVESEKRESFVYSQAENLCRDMGLAMQHESYEMLDSISRCTESPILYSSEVDTYHDLPDAIVKAVMINHQNYVPLFESDGSLSRRFLVFSNKHLDDEGERLAIDAAVCMAARLKDAEFFWLKDIAIDEAEYTEKMRKWTLTYGLGSLAQQSSRIEFMIARLFPQYADIKDAARLVNFDLCMNTIFEFPELHGKISAIYAEKFCNASKNIVSAIEWSGGMSAGIPLEALVLGFCTRLDKIIGFIGKGKIPKGSSDQMGVRRAATELVKIGLRLKPAVSFANMIVHAINLYEEQGINLGIVEMKARRSALKIEDSQDALDNLEEEGSGKQRIQEDVLAFMKERLGYELEQAVPLGRMFVVQEITWNELDRARHFTNLETEVRDFIFSFYKRLCGILLNDFSASFGVMEVNPALYETQKTRPENAAAHLALVVDLFKRAEKLLESVYLKDLAADSRKSVLEFLAYVKSVADEYANFGSVDQ